MNKKSHEVHRKSIGPRGGHNTQSDFFMGSYATLEKILKSIEEDNLEILKEWGR